MKSHGKASLPIIHWILRNSQIIHNFSFLHPISMVIIRKMIVSMCRIRISSSQIPKSMDMIIDIQQQFLNWIVPVDLFQFSCKRGELSFNLRIRPPGSDRTAQTPKTSMTASTFYAICECSLAVVESAYFSWQESMFSSQAARLKCISDIGSKRIATRKTTVIFVFIYAALI